MKTNHEDDAIVSDVVSTLKHRCRLCGRKFNVQLVPGDFTVGDSGQTAYNGYRGEPLARSSRTDVAAKRFPDYPLPDDLSEIDEAIRPLVVALNRDPDLCTTSSCQGHHDRGFDAKNVDVAVRGLGRIAKLVRLLDRLQRAFDELWISCDLTFSSEVATVTDFEYAPDWVTFSIGFENLEDNSRIVGPDTLRAMADVVTSELLPHLKGD